MVRSTRDWRWSSYRATAGLSQAPVWLAPAPWHELRGQIWLGDERFRDRMARLVKDKNLDAVLILMEQGQRPSAVRTALRRFGW